MKRLGNLGLTFCFAGMLSYGANWNAKLLDADCASSSSNTKTSGEKLAKACAPTSSTSTLAVAASGKVFKLDPGGNEMVSAAMKQGTIKPDKDGDVHVAVNGTSEGDTIKVDSVSGTGEHGR